MSIDFPAELSEWDEGTTFMAHLDETIHRDPPWCPAGLDHFSDSHWSASGSSQELRSSCGVKLNQQEKGFEMGYALNSGMLY